MTDNISLIENNELEEKIQSAQGEKSELEKQLNKLKVAEFEEDMATESTQTLLKG